MDHWTCTVCTIQGNPSLFLSCSICSAARPINQGTSATAAQRPNQQQQGTSETTARSEVIVLDSDSEDGSHLPVVAEHQSQPNQQQQYHRQQQHHEKQQHSIANAGWRPDRSITTSLSRPLQRQSSVASTTLGSQPVSFTTHTTDNSSRHQQHQNNPWNKNNNDGHNIQNQSNDSQTKKPAKAKRKDPTEVSKKKSLPDVVDLLEDDTGTATTKRKMETSEEATNFHKTKAAKRKEPAVATINKNSNEEKHQQQKERRPPRYTASVSNLSDRQFCCVWSVEVFEDGYRPDVARELLARVARHVNPILRERGWRCKRLVESTSSSWIGLCTTNGRNDADYASTNIQLNLRVQPSKQCRQFRTFSQVLSVMLHEITHTKIGLEDIHPPAFWELLEEVKTQYRSLKKKGEAALEYASPDCDYGCSKLYTTQAGEVLQIQESARDLLGADPLRTTKDLGGTSGETVLKTDEADQCGVKKRRRRYVRRHPGSSQAYSSNVPKKRPLLKGAKLMDGRTKAGKEAKAKKENFTPQQLSARAALARLGRGTFGKGADEDETCSTSSSSDEEEDDIVPHIPMCACRSCEWDKLLFLPKKKET